MIVFFRKIWN